MPNSSTIHRGRSHVVEVPPSDERHGRSLARALKAPAAHGEALVEPHGSTIPRILQENRHRAAVVNIEVGGIPFQRLLAIARTELLHCAQQYVREYLPVDGVPPDTVPVLLAGHQPELFHPGVWFKNFLLSELGNRQQGVAIHLITDQDVTRNAGLRVPTGSIDEPELRFVPWDSYGPQVPAEELQVLDQDRWRSFGQRVELAVQSLIPDPLIRQLWPAVRAASERTGPAYALSQARHLLERSWGLRTWEVPLSQVCGGRAFHYFVWHILDHLPRFHDVFQRALRGYRRRYGLRSLTHPFPALQAASDALETPFWIWTADDPRRKPLWIQKTRHGWQLHAGEWSSTSIRETLTGREPATCVEQMLEWAAKGTKIRPRAVTTTMFARLLLCDLFVHGLGGSKYDRLTDEVLEQFWEVTPPNYLTATATLRMPWSQPSATADDLRCLQGELREHWYHPEYYLDGLVHEERQEAESIADRKRKLVVAPPPRGQRRGWHDEIVQINQRLRQLTEPIRGRLYQLRDELESGRRADEILSSREFPYCIFPESDLCGPLLDMARRFA